MSEDSLTEEEMPSNTAIPKVKQAKQTLRKAMHQKLSQVSGKSVSEQSVEAVTVASKLLSMDVYMKSKSISIYLSMLNGEVMTRKIVKDALARGKKVYVPFIDARSMDYGKDRESVRRMHMNMVSLRSKEDLKQCELRRDKWGIPSISPDSVSSRFSILDPDCGRIWKDESPSEKRLWLPSLEEQESTEATLDMIVVPGLAFDRQCRRLGHGKGYYDIFLESYHTEKVDRSKGKTMPYVVGLALNEQVLPPEESIPVHKNDWVLDALLMGDGSIFRNERAPRESVIEKIDPLDLGPSRTEIF